MSATKHLITARHRLHEAFTKTDEMIHRKTATFKVEEFKELNRLVTEASAAMNAVASIVAGNTPPKRGD